MRTSYPPDSWRGQHTYPCGATTIDTPLRSRDPGLSEERAPTATEPLVVRPPAFPFAYAGVVTVAAGRMSSRPSPRWLMVVGALFAVALFGGSPCGGETLPPLSMTGLKACPNVVLQASLPGALAVETGGEAPDGGHGTSEPVAGACLIVVVALAGLAMAGAARRPVLVHLAYWWARLRVPLPWSPVAGVMRVDVLRV
jgi:hypothetical protein